MVTYLYDTYFGRGPTAAEIGVWQTLISGGDDFTAMRSVLLNDASGQAHTTAEVTSLYDSYFGRDPTGGELGVWSNLIAAGQDFTSARSALLGASSNGQPAHAAVTSLYDEFFGRDPTPGELETWDGLLAGGKTLFQVQATLEAQSATGLYS